jgi:RND family efflux transporter MFP subunit
MKRELILRQPQLRAARARVESARAAVEQAELDLERTTVTAPFDAHILSRNVNLGSQVSPDEPLGRLVGLNTYWVETEVPLSRLQRLTFPRGPNETGSEVRIRNATAWPEGVYRTGYLYRLIGELEGRTRMARVLVAVDDPMGYRTDAADLPALMIGAYVEARIVSRPLSDVVRLSRDYVREGDTVWVMEDDKLSIREVKIAFQNQEYAFIRDGLDASDRVVTSNLATVVDGAALRVAEASEPAQTADRPASADDESATREAG